MAEPADGPELSAGAAPADPVADPAIPSADLREAQESKEATQATVGDLPPFAHGLLKIRVPLRVTLAAQRKSIQDIIELGPGAIVKFAKTCDEPLELCVGDRLIAKGEVVKVGDKFGVRIGARK
jgi:flagellar motor switch protein FliN/FliY